MSPKGRPTDDPKTINYKLRLSEEDVRKLQYCVEKTGKRRSEIIRLGIDEVFRHLSSGRKE